MKNEISQKVLEGGFLTPREKAILKMRLEGKTLEEIGNEIGRTRERVRQIGKRINKKIVMNLNSEELKRYIREVKSRGKFRYRNFLEKARAKYPKAYMKWLPEEEMILRKEYFKFIKEVTPVFQRSSGAIRARLRKLFKKKLI